MRYKKHMLLLALAIFLLGIAGSWASDTNDTVIDTVDEQAIELSNDDIIAADENEDALKVNEQTFGDLNNTINGNSDRDIYLDSDYKYSEEDSAFKDGIVIDRDLNVYGNGHTINGSNQARIFKINNRNVVFHNITFTNGNTSDDGGAIYGECTAIDCTFTNNHANWGGAMVSGSAINCTFTGNTASVGGAMSGGSAINCTFTSNTASIAGAMAGGSAINCTFTSNTAEDYGGGAMMSGSAINCTFTGNTAKWDGGAIYESSAINCTFTNNTAEDYGGGAMYRGFAINCTFTGNFAEDYGGAIRYGYAINCTFTGNIAEDYGGAMYQSSAINCTFTNNRAVIGGAMFNSYYLACIGQEGDYYGCNPLDLYFDVSDFTSTYKSNKMFRIILKGQDGRIDFINVDVVIYKDGVGEVMRYSCLSGDSLIFDLAAGNYTAELNITYPNLDPISKNIILTINKATPKIEVTANESTYPNLIVNVKTDVSGEYMVTAGNKTQIVTLEANVAKDITFTGLAANETGYIVNVTNMDIENCTKAFNDTAKAILHKATPKIEVTANESTYPDVVVVNVKSDVGGIYEVKIGDKTQIVTLEANVTQNITFTGLAANETGYTVNVTHDSENYTGFNITILKIKKAAPTITAAGITATYNINMDLVITLTDVKGNPMAGEKITVQLNGIKTYITDKNGQIKVTTKGLTPKTYTAAITFNGNTNYTKTSKNVKVTVKKAKAKIIAKKKTFKAKKKVKKFTITLKDNKGKAIKNAKVTLKAIKIKKTSKNKTKKTGKKNILKAKTNKKGKATFKINRNKGKYQVIIKYKGNKYYKSVTKKVKITIK